MLTVFLVFAVIIIIVILLQSDASFCSNIPVFRVMPVLTVFLVFAVIPVNLR